MCLSRGDCENLFDDHGDPRNITMTAMQNAANAASITVPEALSNIQRGVSRGLTGMTDWTGDQQGGSSLVLGNYAETPANSAQAPSQAMSPDTPSPTERSPYS